MGNFEDKKSNMILSKFDLTSYDNTYLIKLIKSSTLAESSSDNPRYKQEHLDPAEILNALKKSEQESTEEKVNGNGKRHDTRLLISRNVFDQFVTNLLN